MPRLLMVEEVPSTMDELHQHAQHGGEHGLAVVAREQVSARGRLGRQWSSGIGGLWFSVLMRHPGSLELDVLSLRVGLAVAHALEVVLPSLPPVMLKWPNDLWIGERKVGGILIEARWQNGVAEWVVIGVGVNLHNPVPPSLRGQAISLGEVAAAPAPEILAPVLVDAVRDAMERRGTLQPDELEWWGRRDALDGRTITIPIAGIAEGITSDGSLRVRDMLGHLTLVRTGEVAADGTFSRD